MNDKIHRAGGKTYKELVIAVLPTLNKSSLYYLNGKFKIGDDTDSKNNCNIYLYFLSNNKIGLNDWYIWLNNSQVCQAEGDLDILNNHLAAGHVKKIEASTDKTLNDNGVARPSDDFLRVYCELDGISKVLIEYEEKFEPSYEGLDSPLWDVELSQLEPTDFKSTGEYRLKVAADGTITIKSLEVKESWNRKEVGEIIFKFIHSNSNDIVMNGGKYNNILVIEDWIKKNI